MAGNLLVQVLITLAALSLYPAGIILRNIYFHPLSKFPGPKTWAATQIPYIISLLSGRLVKDQQRLHQQYGDVIRIGPNEISFAKEEAWQDISKSRPGHSDVTKDETWYIAPNDKPQNIVTTNDHAVHARMRKLLGTSFSESSLRSQQPTIESFADLLIDRLRTLLEDSRDERHGVVVNMVDWINYFTVDVIGDLAVGESFDCLRNSNYHPWVKTLFNFLQGMIYAATARFYPAVEWLFKMSLPKSVMELQRKHTEFVNERINRRLNLKTDRPDFLTPFMKDNVNYENMSLGEIESTFAIIIVAGSEATTTSLCGILNKLVKSENKGALEKLVSEIRGTFVREQDITIEATKHLPYLEAVINEGLRICNPVPGGLPRVVPKGGDTYAGHFIPEKTSISVRPYVINHSDTFFASANSFIPERWLPKDQRPAKFASDHLSASNPFSVGPTSCIGRNLAWAEMPIVLARLLWAFDVAEEEGKGLDWDSQKTLMIIHKEPLELRIKLREGVVFKDRR